MSHNAPLARGWRDRQTKAQNRNGDAEKARIAAERARFYEAQRLEAQAQAAAEAERRARARCTCPLCDGDGTVLASKAELVIRALERLPSDSAVDRDVLGILTAISAGEAVHSRHGLPLRHGLSYPRRVGSDTADVTPADGPAEITPAETVKPAPARKTKAAPPAPPWLDPDAVLEQ